MTLRMLSCLGHWFKKFQKRSISIYCLEIFCDILVMKIFTIFPCPKSLDKAKMKRFGLI